MVTPSRTRCAGRRGHAAQDAARAPVLFDEEHGRAEKCHPAATMFVLKSRLFDMTPMHHGLLSSCGHVGPHPIKGRARSSSRRLMQEAVGRAGSIRFGGRSREEGRGPQGQEPEGRPPNAAALGAVRLGTDRRAGEAAAPTPFCSSPNALPYVSAVPLC